MKAILTSYPDTGEGDPDKLMQSLWAVAALLAGAAATTPASEVAALREFYGALGGDGWLDNHLWSGIARARDPPERGSARRCVCECHRAAHHLKRRRRRLRDRARTVLLLESKVC